MLLSIVLLLSGCSFKTYDEYKLPEDLTIELNENNIEVFNEFNVKDLVKNTNGDLLSDETIYVDEIGKKEYTLKIKYDDKVYKKDITYNVIDTEAPVYINASTSRTVEVNDAIYPCSNVVFADNYDSVPNCEVIGDYDLTKVGNYNVKYVITDSSGNKNEKDLTISVVDKIVKNNNHSSSSRSKLFFNDIISRYKNDNTMVGIDVSRWQGEIDFNKVKEAGAEFVIMRIGVHNDVDSELSMDKYFKQNIKNAKAAGLKVGVYLYTTAIDTDTASEQAKWIIKNLDGEQLDLGVTYDWENWSKFMQYQINLHTFYNCYYTFRDVLKEAGYESMLYASKFYLENIWDGHIGDSPVWLAHYISETTYKGKYYIWQKGDTGRIDGINGAVDIDILYKNNK